MGDESTWHELKMKQNKVFISLLLQLLLSKVSDQSRFRGKNKRFPDDSLFVGHSKGRLTSGQGFC